MPRKYREEKNNKTNKQTENLTAEVQIQGKFLSLSFLFRHTSLEIKHEGKNKGENPNHKWYSNSQPESTSNIISLSFLLRRAFSKSKQKTKPKKDPNPERNSNPKLQIQKQFNCLPLSSPYIPSEKPNTRFHEKQRRRETEIHISPWQRIGDQAYEEKTLWSESSASGGNRARQARRRCDWRPWWQQRQWQWEQRTPLLSLKKLVGLRANERNLGFKKKKVGERRRKSWFWWIRLGDEKTQNTHLRLDETEEREASTDKRCLLALSCWHLPSPF